ncbi:hypothetical protein [Streptomyces sp. NBC_00370]|uniref:hypothetical protein n=1 Tax=Streptomyces sp. NBC_00370 TaxID=2975728 RepID=UPI002E27290D
MRRPIVPYVIPWAGETISHPEPVITPAGIHYADPHQDQLHRDLDTLWEQCTGDPTGQPQYTAELHPARQKKAMEGLLCAGCKAPAARYMNGMTWVLPLYDDTPPDHWDGVHTTIPPMCKICAKMAPQWCPRLREGHVELRVREAEHIGVRGTLYPRPGEPGVPDPDALVLFDSPDLPFVVARHVVRELHRTTLIRFAAAAT